ncbi:MAG: C25 family cysteine peptidase [Bacteroidales bacterium]|jgi:hypothetical protein|nr:C25 family cysteine peptidase [Bacteroidales bacterium]
MVQTIFNFQFSIFNLILFLPLFGISQTDNPLNEKMLIVSHHSFIPFLSEFTKAKEKDNIDCLIISVDSTDDFNSIKDRIDTRYADGFHADFLLLVGDFEHVPACKIDEGLSDMYYTLENENDPVPRMIAGRFPAKTEQELKTMIDRSINHRVCSRHVLGIASEEKSELTQKRDYEQLRSMGETLLSKGFSQASECFDGSQSGNDKDGNPTAEDILDLLDQGITWINYAGYGSYDGWNTSGFESRHIPRLNNSEELPIIVSASCLGGHFANRECFAEQWLRSSKDGNPTGARAVIMSSLLSDWDATLSAMSVVNDNMPSVDSNCRLADLYRLGYLHIVRTMLRPKEAYCWVLFGDPSIRIYPSSSANAVENKTLPEKRPLAYPNPASSQLHISTDGMLRLYDVHGRTVYEKQSTDVNNTIDVSRLSQGVYFLTIENKAGYQQIIITK